MSSHVTAIDISNMPELLDLVQEVEATQKPRELRRDNKPVALLTPIIENTEKWKKIKPAFGSWSDADADTLIANIQRWRAEGSRPATRP
jgi:antitoxin (DNA-binding transcriptional repressor) of toxin-antitoxin stability system